MVGESKRTMDDEKLDEAVAIEKPEDSTEEAETAEAIDMLEGLPIPEKKIVSREMIRMMGVMKQENPIVKKITSEHIDKFLDGSKLELEESYKEKHERKIFQFMIFTVALVFIGVLAWMLKDKEDLLEKILYTLGGLVAGAFGGYGYGKKSGDDD